MEKIRKRQQIKKIIEINLNIAHIPRHILIKSFKMVFFANLHHFYIYNLNI